MMALMQMPAKITAFFLTLSSDKYVILLLINVLLLVLGCLVDMAPSILIRTPILLPVMMKFGVDPVHFGMIMLLNLGHRPVPSAGRRDPVRRLRRRPGAHGGGDARDLAVLRGDVRSC